MAELSNSNIPCSREDRTVQIQFQALDDGVSKLDLGTQNIAGVPVFGESQACLSIQNSQSTERFKGDGRVTLPRALSVYFVLRSLLIPPVLLSFVPETVNFWSFVFYGADRSTRMCGR